jgi:hypothetical protein
MIYDKPDPSADVRQGDIFRAVPRIDVALKDLQVIETDSAVPSNWAELPQVLSGLGEPVTALVSIRPVTGIVLSQDCDALHSADVTLAEVLPFAEVEKALKSLTIGSSNWVRKILQQARINQKWFYLPKSADLEFAIPMAADFRSLIKVSQPDLESMRAKFRIGRLNGIATAHFRERASEFFRRYAHDEWYSLTKEELEIYAKLSGSVTPFPWQV